MPILASRQLLDRGGDGFQRGRIVREPDHRENERREPEVGVVGEQRQQGQNGHDFELHLVRRAVRQMLGQRVEFEIKDTQQHDQHNEENTHDHQKHVGFARCGDEGRQMMRCKWVDLVFQGLSPD